MTCAKQKVICKIKCDDGTEVIGENYCNNPQSICPRDVQGYGTGEGYHLCQDICDQEGHAEDVAARLLNGKVPESATLEGHSYACEPCKSALRSVGLKAITINGRSHKL